MPVFELFGFAPDTAFGIQKHMHLITSLLGKTFGLMLTDYEWGDMRASTRNDLILFFFCFDSLFYIFFLDAGQRAIMSALLPIADDTSVCEVAFFFFSALGRFRLGLFFSQNRSRKVFFFSSLFSFHILYLKMEMGLYDARVGRVNGNIFLWAKGTGIGQPGQGSKAAVAWCCCGFFCMWKLRPAL